MALDPTAHRFKRLSEQLALLPLDSEAAIAIASFGVGALFGLRQAYSLGYRDRTTQVAVGDLATEVTVVAAELGDSDSTTRLEWLAGLYFNLALERIDATNHRLAALRKLRRSHSQRDAPGGTVERDVGHLKHRPKGLFGGRGVDYESALGELEELVGRAVEALR